MSKVRKEGRPQSPLTRVATEHNWAKLQIKGSAGHMRHILARYSMDAEDAVRLARRIHELETELQKMVEDSYARRKADFLDTRAKIRADFKGARP